MPDAWVDARSMDADEQFVVPGLRFLDVAKLEHVGRAVLVLNDGFHSCRYFLPLLPSARLPSLLSSRLPTALSTDCRASIPGRDGTTCGLVRSFSDIFRRRVLGSRHAGCCTAPVLCSLHPPSRMWSIFLIIPVGATLPLRRSWPICSAAERKSLA